MIFNFTVLKMFVKQTNHREDVRVVGRSLEVVLLRLLLHPEHEADSQAEVGAKSVNEHAVPGVDGLSEREQSFHFDCRENRVPPCKSIPVRGGDNGGPRTTPQSVKQNLSPRFLLFFVAYRGQLTL